jgi:hypothetical protein
MASQETMVNDRNDMKGIKLAKCGGVMMSRPHHTSITFQPLDKSVFGPFQVCEYCVTGIDTNLPVSRAPQTVSSVIRKPTSIAPMTYVFGCVVM